MLVEIDASLLTESSAVGRVSGPLEFMHLPRVGETVSLSRVMADGFSGHLVVEHVIYLPNSGSNPLLSLSDIVASSEGAAKLLGAALTKEYGLFFEPYGD